MGLPEISRVTWRTFGEAKSSADKHLFLKLISRALAEEPANWSVCRGDSRKRSNQPIVSNVFLWLCSNRITSSGSFAVESELDRTNLVFLAHRTPCLPEWALSIQTSSPRLRSVFVAHCDTADVTSKYTQPRLERATSLKRPKEWYKDTFQRPIYIKVIMKLLLNTAFAVDVNSVRPMTPFTNMVPKLQLLHRWSLGMDK